MKDLGVVMTWNNICVNLHVFAEIWFDHRIWMQLIASVLSVLLERRSVMTALALATCRRIEPLELERWHSEVCQQICAFLSETHFHTFVGHPKDIWNILKMARGLQFGGMIFRSTWWASQASTGFSTISMRTSPLHGRSMLLLKVVTVWERGAVPLVLAPGWHQWTTPSGVSVRPLWLFMKVQYCERYIKILYGYEAIGWVTVLVLAEITKSCYFTIISRLRALFTIFETGDS